MKNIVVFGATGLLGKPVTKALIAAGFRVTVMARNPELARGLFPEANVIKGDLSKPAEVATAMQGQEAVFMSLSVTQTEKETDWHAEEQGIETIIELAKQMDIKRLLYLSSLVHLYQDMDNFDWWVFRLKRRIVKKIKESKIPFTIFYPSTFMESIFYQSKQGSMIALGGESKYPLYYIAADDYARQVVNSLKLLKDENREYVIQGPEAFRQDVAAKEFIRHYSKQKLRTMWAPMFMMKLMGFFSQKFNYGYHIVTALNNYPEEFEATQTWKELGKPQITLKEFAERMSQREG
ncbi:SDR family oxidoreductase [Emticicia sp. 17c]|uniref:SDR family oxidoreductase n=1 Tax=Emticicia sp. 17c TaxID=3127704 RepID=UPI00301BC467